MRLATAAFAALLPLSAAADPVVVELYTSQGCSSCPPADEMLGELTAHEDVIALSLHVDYWDWIGWEDTFGKAAHSERQRAYASAVGSSVVYTPQFVVGGADQVAGPSGMKLAQLIEAHRGATGDVLRAASTAEGRKVVAMEVEGGGQLVLVTVLPRAEVKIMRGENAGRVMTYHNVVIGWDVLGEWSGEAGSFSLPAPRDGYAQIVLAQRVDGGKLGPILGAVKLD
ncbi:DUF1223 domain-containing protein [Jannaschia seohaensis]|uniref:Secreted protein n=1 Tax=Jannaschia seohaensis TaxID=475081 RepID=A0A2Y9AQ52_9RHOB|nr:DUF1223 domain-containing protein [Jannaschia seohaensis]PWJ18018.1 hypothetical protein BCF38_1055 [Jannaschia seohaensis]SSA46540.1 hypothetical protein SAMN05421539_1055 [Jannaschia seohaensis]